MQRLSSQKLARIAMTLAVISLPASGGLAQTAPGSGAAPAAAPPASTPPAATSTPAATTAAPAETPSAASKEATTTETAKPKKKQAAKKMTRQQEIDKSIDTGTVPSRYRSSVPKEYHHLIPFDKR